MKKGDRVRCANNTAARLTLNKIYEIIDISFMGSNKIIHVYNDIYELEQYYFKRFELIKEEKVMKKSDLKSGMVVKYRNCAYDYALVVDDRLLDLDCYMLFKDFNEDLENDDKDYDIVAIYEVVSWAIGLKKLLQGEHLTLIWQREETKITIEVTKEQLEEIKFVLGLEVKVVEEKC